jgi:hypothetical protein
MRHRRESLTVGPGSVLRRFSAVDYRRLCSQWLQAFGGNGQANTSMFLWHVFSYGQADCLLRPASRDEYARQVAPSFIVLADNGEQALETDVLPTEFSVMDCYVFPPNFAWTMAFTHEEGMFGPYFAKHANCEQLNSENILRIRKNAAIASAKAKGWL